jgi:hypothetical protein
MFVARKRLKRKPMSRIFTAIASLAQRLHPRIKTLTAQIQSTGLMPVVAICSGNPAAGTFALAKTLFFGRAQFHVAPNLP